MATKPSGHKIEKIAFRMTPRQRAKVEHIAMLQDLTLSDALRAIIDGVAVDITLPYANSNAGGTPAKMTTGIAR